MSDFRPGVDVVVTNYHTMDDLHNFLMSYGHDSVKSSLWVMNVEGTDEEGSLTQKWLEKIDGERQHFAFPNNIGYAKSCNSGATMGDREVIAFFNADTQLYSNTLSKCHDALMANPDWGIVGPLQVNSDGQITSGGIYGTPTAPTHPAWMKRNPQDYRDARDAVTVIGSAFFIKRSVWNELYNCEIYREQYPNATGAFLETPHYYEETYCCYHAREHGWKVVFYGPAMMVHEWHKASPVGGAAEKTYMPISKQMFRDACAYHSIECD